MDQEVQRFIRLHHSDNEASRHCGENHLLTEAADSVTTGENMQHCSDRENDGDVSTSTTDAGDCLQTNVNNGHSPPKFSHYPNGATRPIDNTAIQSSHNREQNTLELNGTNNSPALTAEQTLEASVSRPLHACNDNAITVISDTETDDIDAKRQNTNQNASYDELSSTTEEEQRQHSPSDSKDDTTELAVTDDGEKAVSEIASTTIAGVNGCAEMAHVDNVTCEEEKVQQKDRQEDGSMQPLDFSMSGLGAETDSAGTSKKLAETSAPDDTQGRKPAETSGATQKAHHPKHSMKSDNYRPAGRLVHDLGLELVREQVYRDLIDIQMVKDAKNRLEDREKGQLLKLIEAQERLAARNRPYETSPVECCSRCGFKSSSVNVMTLHREYGTVSRFDPTIHVCCMCDGPALGFRTRSATQFMTHVSTDHGLTGRLMKKTSPYACKNCLFEHKSAVRLTLHLDKCAKKFSLGTNLQPLPGDCDVPLMYRPSDRKQPGGAPAYTQNSNILSSASASSALGPPSVRTLLSSLRHDVSAGYLAGSCSQPSLICEICGKLVEGREALWVHFRSVHHVELCRTTMRDKEPWMKCDVCSGRFWTYQGLSRHLLLAHNRAFAGGGASFTTTSPTTQPPPVSPPAVAPRCHICGGSQTSNPLSHFSAFHNVTLLEMYHAKLCCICNRKVNSGRAFEQHMVEQHSDIFANYDVLRTVLQALTTARYFKADDTREPTTHHIMQLSARGRSLDKHSARKKFADSGAHTSAAGDSRNYAAAASMTDRKSVMAAASSRSLQTVPRKHNTSGILNSTPKKRLNTNAPGVMKHHKSPTSSSPHARKKHVFMPPKTPEISAVLKPNERATEATAEEVKKLYKDLAHIGRPILRSMRRRLSTSSGSEVVKTASSEMVESATTECEDNSISSEVVSAQQNNGFSTAEEDVEEIPTKKVHLEITTDRLCDAKTDNSI